MLNVIEDSRNEFKVKLVDDLEETIIAFLNSKDGGSIYLGVKDNGEVIGLQNNLDLLQRQIKDRIMSNIEPSALGLFDLEVLSENNKKYLKIIVARGNERPYHLKGMGMTPDSCYIRVGSSTEKMTTTLINKMFSTRTKKSLVEIESPNQELTFKELKMYYIEKGFEVGENFEKQLDLYTKDNKYNYVAYLLADNNKTVINVAKYVGDDVDEIAEYYDYGGCSLITSTFRVLEKFKTENKVYAKITYPERKETTMYDYDAVREAVINAIVHNDWSSEYSPKFEFFNNRLEISSFGGIQEEFTEEEFLKGYSAPKNPELMRVFKDLDLVERLGTGIRKILKKYDKSIFKFYPHFIIVSIKYNKNEFEYSNNSNKTTEIDTINLNLSKTQEDIINLISEKPHITQSEMSAILNITSRMVRYYLSDLVKQGYIKRVGSNKKGSWIITNGGK